MRMRKRSPNVGEKFRAVAALGRLRSPGVDSIDSEAPVEQLAVRSSACNAAIIAGPVRRSAVQAEIDGRFAMASYRRAGALLFELPDERTLQRLDLLRGGLE
jgi:hypothetical protein